MPKTKILIAEDEIIIAMHIKSVLKSKGFDVLDIVSTGEEAIVKTEEHNPDIILMDIMLKGEIDGITAVEEIKARHDIPMIYMTAHSDEKTLNRAKETGPHGYILKPINPKELYSTIEIALYKHGMEKTLQKSESRYRQLFATIKEAVLLFDAKTRRFVDANDSTLKLYGYTKEEFLELSVPDISAEPKETDKAIKEIISGERVEVLHRHHKKKDGTIFPVEISSGILEIDGRMVLCGVVRDISERKQTEEARKDSEERFRTIVEKSDAGYYLIDTDGIIRDVNDAWVKLYRYDSADEIIGKHFSVIQRFKDLEQAKTFVDGILNNKPEYMTGEFSRKCKDGSVGYHTFSSWPVLRSGKTIGIEGFIIDSTESKLAKEALEESESSFNSLYSTMTEGVCMHEIIYDKTGKALDYTILDVNPSYESILGIKREQAIGKTASELYQSQEPPYLELYANVAESGKSTRFEVYFPPMGKHFAISVSSPAKGRFNTIFTDITDRKNSEEQTKASLHEKEVLLAEVHHRVKNNMQVISSLLSLQSIHIRDEKDREIFHDSQNRIHSMAMVHEHLYQSNNLSRIEFSEYIKRLVYYLVGSYNIKMDNIELKLSTEKIYIDINHAIPCGMLINELVSNSLKYAFPEDNIGEICVDFKKDNMGTYTITIADNGIGFAEDFDCEKSGSLGLQLVNAFVKQLNGKITLMKSKGTTYVISFPL